MRRIVHIFSAGGTEQVPGADGITYTLPAGTYFAELFDDVPNRTGMSIHWEWNAALVATITFEATNYDARDVSAHSATLWRTTGATTVSPAASASGTVAHYADYMAARMRAKIVVTTQGTLSGIEHSKARGAR